MNDSPRKLNTSPGHIAASVIASGVCGYTIKFNISRISQPLASTLSTSKVPEVLNDWPWKLNTSPGQIAASVITLTGVGESAIVTLHTEEQPNSSVTVTVNVPAGNSLFPAVLTPLLHA